MVLPSGEKATEYTPPLCALHFSALSFRRGVGDSAAAAAASSACLSTFCQITSLVSITPSATPSLLTQHPISSTQWSDSQAPRQLRGVAAANERFATTMSAVLAKLLKNAALKSYCPKKLLQSVETLSHRAHAES